VNGRETLNRKEPEAWKIRPWAYKSTTEVDELQWTDVDFPTQTTSLNAVPAMTAGARPTEEPGRTGGPSRIAAAVMTGGRIPSLPQKSLISEPAVSAGPLQTGAGNWSAASPSRNIFFRQD